MRSLEKSLPCYRTWIADSPAQVDMKRKGKAVKGRKGKAGAKGKAGGGSKGRKR